MASGVKVRIDDKAIISALNTPGGGVYEWRDQIGQEVRSNAEGMAPINDPMNAEHRGGEVGTYKASFDFDRRGSSGHHVVARVLNTADHAIYVERGRSASWKMQIFSWTEWDGAIQRVGGPGKLPDMIQISRRRFRPLSRGERAYNARIGKMPKRVGDHTNARAGQHILARALIGAMGSAGITARVDM